MAGSKRALNKLNPAAWKAMLGDLIYGLVASFNGTRNHLLSSAGLAISAGASPLVRAANAFLVNINGTTIMKAAGNMPALVGTILGTGSTDFAAWPFYIDKSGTLTTGAKTADSADAATALALIPQTPDHLALVGVLLVQNAISANGNFVGGTTALDAAGVTATYFSVTGPGIHKGAALTQLEA